MDEKLTPDMTIDPGKGAGIFASGRSCKAALPMADAEKCYSPDVRKIRKKGPRPVNEANFII